MYLFRFFSTSNPAILIVLPILLFFVWFKAIIGGVPSQFLVSEYQMPLYMIAKTVTLNKGYLYIISGIVLIIIQAIMLIRLNIKYIFIDNRSFLPVVLFILISGCLTEFQKLYPALCANVFIILAIDKVFGSYKKEKSTSNVFDSSLLIGVASLFYFNAVYFLVFIWIAFLIIKPLRPGEWFISIIGFIAPYFFSASYFYLTDQLPLFIETIEKCSINAAPIINKNESHYAIFILLSVLSVASIFFFLQGINVKKIAIRRYFAIFILIVVFCIAAVIAFKTISLEALIITTAPLSILISYYLINVKKKWIKEFWFDILLLLTTALQFFNFN